MKVLGPLLGFLIMLFYAWRRLRLPLPHGLPELQQEYFGLVVYLSVLYLAQLLLLLWLSRPRAGVGLENLGKSVWFPRVQEFFQGLRKTPQIFYEKIRPHLGAPWEKFLGALRNGAGRLDPDIFFFGFHVIPGLVPPMTLLLTFWLSAPLEYFYYSLPLLGLRWIHLILVHVLTEWADRQVNLRLGQALVQGQWQPSETWSQDYFQFLRGNAFLGSINRCLDTYKLPLFFLNSLVYFLAWFSILVSALISNYGYKILWIWT